MSGPANGDAGIDVPYAELHLELPRRAETVTTVRHVVRHLLTEAGVETAVVEEVELAASELSTNAVLHAGVGDTYQVGLSLNGLSCEIVIADHGPGFDPQAVPLPAIELPGGRGLAIVRAVMDEVTIESAPGLATTIRSRKQLVRPDANADAARHTSSNLEELVSVVASAVSRFSAMVAALGGAIA